MKVYVREMPKGCLTCPYIVDKGDYDLCAIKDYVIDDAFKYVDKRKKSCPLLSLADYTKQVRKEVIEQIKKNADVILEEGVYENYITGEKTIMTKTIYNIDEVKLDQIQGETKCQKK